MLCKIHQKDGATNPKVYR